VLTSYTLNYYGSTKRRYTRIIGYRFFLNILTLFLVGTHRIDIGSISHDSLEHSNKPMSGPRLNKAHDFGTHVLRTDEVSRHSLDPCNLHKPVPL
jgi:hypothetical protein